MIPRLYLGALSTFAASLSRYPYQCHISVHVHVLAVMSGVDQDQGVTLAMRVEYDDAHNYNSCYTSHKDLLTEELARRKLSPCGIIVLEVGWEHIVTPLLFTPLPSHSTFSVLLRSPIGSFSALARDCRLNRRRR